MANRLAMPRGILRFRCSVGTMRDEPAALRGEAADLVTTRGFYAFDGPRGRYDLVFSVEDMSKNYVQTGPTMSSSVLPVMSQRLATDGTKTLFDLISLTADRKALGHSFNLDTGVDQFHRNKLMIPLQLGEAKVRTGLAADIDAALKPDSGCHLVAVDERAHEDGVAVTMLTFEADGERRQYAVDLARGAVPRSIRSTSLDPKTPYENLTRHDDITRVAGKAWLPLRHT